MLSEKILQKIRECVGKENVLTAQEDLAVYSYDATALLRQVPSAVVKTQGVEHIVAMVKLANQEGFPIVPRGSGSGLSGGAIPMEGCVVLLTPKMNRILEIDPYNVTENSGGLRGMKYGVTQDYILGLEAVLPTGEVIWTGGKSAKGIAGYNLRRLFVGSEGTLGIFTKILVKLLPKPAAKKTLVAFFPKVSQAAETVAAIIAHPVIPATLEILDQTTIRCVEDYAK